MHSEGDRRKDRTDDGRGENKEGEGGILVSPAAMRREVSRQDSSERDKEQA